MAKFALADLLHTRKSRGKEDEEQNSDDWQETWQEVFSYPHFHPPVRT